MPVTIGVDPHKASHTVAALDERGQLLDRQHVPATLVGNRALRQWAGQWHERRWAVEGAHGIGRALAQRLVSDGEQVLDVPAKLATRVRVLSVGHGRKSDPDDAVSVAVAARNAGGLRQVKVEDTAVVLHLLTKRREDLVAARTQTIHRLHRLLIDLVPGRRQAQPHRQARRGAAGRHVPGRGRRHRPVPVQRPSAGQAYYRRKLAEGKSPKEALRCLKRRLSDAVYRCLVADQHLQPSLVGPRPA
jgi:hypothetical protein